YPADEADDLVHAATGEGLLALRFGRPHRSDPNSRVDVADRHVDQVLEPEYHVDAVEPHHHARERLRLRLARVLHGSDDRVVADDSPLGEVDVVLLRELDRVDRAVTATAREKAANHGHHRAEGP